MKTKTDLLKAARGYLGIVERPPGSNRTIIGQRFGYNGVPWCAEFVWDCLSEAGFHVRKNASAYGLTDALVRLGWKKVDRRDIRSGDIVRFRFSHVGICEAKRGDGRLTVIEGNHGNACKRVVRSTISIAWGVRPPFAAEAAPKLTASRRYPGKLVKVGSKGLDVRWVQKRLTKHGIRVPNDGVFTVNDRAAVRKFQKRKRLGIIRLGIVGPKTWAALAK